MLKISKASEQQVAAFALVKEGGDDLLFILEVAFLPIYTTHDSINPGMKNTMETDSFGL